MAGLFAICLQMLLRCAIQVAIYQMSEDKEYVITTCAKLKYLHSNHLLPMLTLVTRLLTEPQSFHTPQSSRSFPWLPPREPCPLKQQQHIIRNTILYCAIDNLQRKTHNTYILLNVITKYHSNSSVI